MKNIGIFLHNNFNDGTLLLKLLTDNVNIYEIESILFDTSKNSAIIRNIALSKNKKIIQIKNNSDKKNYMDISNKIMPRIDSLILISNSEDEYINHLLKVGTILGKHIFLFKNNELKKINIYT